MSSSSWKVDRVFQVTSGGEHALASLQLSKDNMPFTETGAGKDGDPIRAILDAICKRMKVTFFLSEGKGTQSFGEEDSIAHVVLISKSDDQEYAGKGQHRKYYHAVASAMVDAINSASS